MMENPEVNCDVCGNSMHRVPQVVDHYNNPQDTLYNWLDKRHENKIREREAKKRRERRRATRHIK